MNTLPKSLQYDLNAFGGTHRISFPNKQFRIVKEEMSKTEFSELYKPRWYKLTAAINDGRIAIYLKNGRVLINVREALRVMWPGCHIED